MPERAKKWLILLPLLLGIGILVFLVKNRAQPEQAPLTEQPRPVRVIEIPKITVVPRALGYGNVAPGKVWEAVAEVSGKIAEIHPQLKKGALLSESSVLLRIDPSDYQLAAVQIETNIQATQAQLAELEVKEANTRISLGIEKEALGLGEKELARKRQLVARGTVTRSEFEQEERSVLAQRQGVQSLQNTLNLIPAERRLLVAQRARDEAQLQSAKLDLERTTLKSPFAGRVAEVNVELTEYVRQGEVLAVIDSIDVAEVAAQIPLSRFGSLIRSQKIFSVIEPNMEDLPRTLGLSARVWLRGESLQVVWEGRVARISDTIDPQTRTVGVIVEVDDPYKDIQPGVRPPLLKGMFVEVELRGRPRHGQLVIPRSALYGDQVYVVDSDNRLQKRTVNTGLVQPGFVTVNEGLKPGERMVISDLIPAISGMLLKPLPDEDALERLIQNAQGTGITP